MKKNNEQNVKASNATSSTKAGTSTAVGSDGAISMNTAHEIDAEAVMSVGTPNCSALNQGDVDVAAAIGADTNDCTGADETNAAGAVSDANTDLNNNSRDSKGTAINAVANSNGNASISGDVGSSTAPDNSVTIDSCTDEDSGIVHGNADDISLNFAADSYIDISRLPADKTQGFPYENFPKWVRDQIVDVCQAVQAPIPIAANLLLSLVAACTARNVYVLGGKQREPTNFWSITLAEAGIGKTPVFAMMKEPLVNSEMINHMVSDITIPFFVQLLEEKHKLFMLDDELGFLVKLTQGNDFDHSSLVNSYNETTFSHGRCKSGLKIIRNPSLTIGIAGQQGVFIKRLLNCEIGKYLEDSGVLDRMAIVFVDSGRKVYMTDPPCNDESIAATYQEKMSWLISLGQKLEEEGLDSIELKLSHEANRRRCEVLNAWEDELKINEEFKMILKWIRKADGLSLRLAGIIYMIFLVAEGYPVTLATLPPISVEVMEVALRLLEYYRDQTISWRLQVSSEVRSTFALRVFRSIRQIISRNHSDYCSMRDVKQSLRDEHGQLDEIAFNAAIQELVDNGWITVEEPPKAKRRGRPASARIRIIRGHSQKAAA